MAKMTQENERRLTCNTKHKKVKKKGWNSTYLDRETDGSKLKSFPRRSIMQSWFCNQMSREEEFLERSQRTLEKYFLEKCFLEKCCVLK